MSRTGIRKCRRRSHSDRIRVRRLGFESLESRRLLTLAAFEFKLYEDTEGTPGAAIEGGTVGAGDTFFLEVLAEDLQPDPLGLHGISLDIRWDPDIFSVADPFSVAAIVTDSLPLLTFGTLEPDIGRINDLTGSAGLGFGVGELVGLHGPESFALIRFEALQAVEESQFALRGGKYGIAFFPPIWDQPSDFYFDVQSITVEEAIQEAPLEPTTEVSSSPDAAATTTVSDKTTPADEGNLAVPRIEASTGSVATRASHEFTTVVTDGTTIANTLVRAVPPDDHEPLESPSIGEAPTTTLKLQFGGPGVTDIGPAHWSVQPVAEGERQANNVASSNACVADSAHRINVPLTSQAAARREPKATAFSRPFVGPLPPQAYATRWILAKQAIAIANHANPSQLDDDLVDMLATDVTSQQGPLTL